MPCVEGGLDEEHKKKDNGQRKVCWQRGFSQRFPGDKYKYASGQQNGSKASKEIAKDLPEPIRRRRRRNIPAILDNASLNLLCGQPLLWRGSETIEKLVDGNSMPFQIGKFY